MMKSKQFPERLLENKKSNQTDNLENKGRHAFKKETNSSQKPGKSKQSKIPSSFEIVKNDPEIKINNPGETDINQAFKGIIKQNSERSYYGKCSKQGYFCSQLFF